ncbi:MAG: DUF3048 domain-containing protein [Clostridiales bacterium]|nr:DUF3048 domain-containing protein [Clostridiales bacterium]
MKKLLLIILTLVMLAGCGTDAVVDSDPPVTKEPTLAPTIEPTMEPTEEPVATEPAMVESGPISKLNGLPLENEGDDDNSRIFAVMFDNAAQARWQAGLKEASVVYEIRVEGQYTRYVGIFQTNNQDLVLGAVRSARPYFAQTVAEYDAIFAHHGGSEAGIDKIKELGIDNVDGMFYDGSVYKRQSHKKAPHNSYTSIGALNKKADDLKYKTSNNFGGFKFFEEPTAIGGTSAKSVEILYGSNTTEYFYDETTVKYERHKDGKLHLDENNSEPLEVSNIIIQYVDVKLHENKTHKVLSNVGSGTGLLISHGEMVEIQWSKQSESAQTQFTTKEGETITLNPGQTWIQWIEKSRTINIE